MNKQVKNLKENWLLVFAILIAVFFANVLSGVGSYTSIGSTKMVGGAQYDTGYYYQEDFAPDSDVRYLTKTLRMTSEVDYGTFDSKATDVNSLIDSTDAYLLDETINEYERGAKSYKVGNYEIKIQTQEYDSFITELQEIGDVTYFSENTEDITERYTNLEEDLDREKERLQRYEEMYEDATKVEDKITLSDKIFQQERLIENYEQALENIENKVDYSTIYFTLTEEESPYADAVFIKLSEIVRAFVDSINTMIKIVVILIPWIIIGLILRRALR